MKPREQHEETTAEFFIGSALDDVMATLRIRGDELNPALIDEMLGVPATNARQKGDADPTRPGRVSKRGVWLLRSGQDRNVDLDTHITAILSQTTNDLSVWRTLTDEFQVDIFCGLFLKHWNSTFSISPAIVDELSRRGIALGFDVYSHKEP